MNLLEKIEALLNTLLLKLGALLISLVPAPIWRVYNSIVAKWNWLATLPKIIFDKLKQIIQTVRANIFVIDYKSVLMQTFNASLARYTQAQPGKKLGKAKLVFMAPFLMISGWLQGLSAAQSLVLMGFSAASFLAGVSIIFSGHRMMNGSGDGRAPASIESEQSQYDRPLYYKKQARHLEFTALRIPVHIPKVNELKSVDIDFTVTLSTRHARELLSKKEFQLRDHLILNVEPSVAAFPLEDEGKEIMRQKLTEEIENFMKEHKIPGSIAEFKITYILAN